MAEEIVANFELNNVELTADIELSEGEQFDALFEINTQGAAWGQITGNIENQTDLYNILNDKADISTVSDLNDTVVANYDELSTKTSNNSTEISNISTTINGYGDIVNYDASYFATATQGALANSAVQPSDLATVATTGNYNDLTNKPDIPIVNDATLTIQKNGSNIATFTANSATNQTANITVPTQASDICALPNTTTINDLTTTAQQDALNSGATSTNIEQIATNTQNISDEVTNRQNADYNLQQQIDAITSASDVTDIVGTYAELQAYDTTNLPDKSIIKVLQDESRDDETTYYRWVITNSVGAWVLIGEEGPYYTKSQADSTFVPQTRTINGYSLDNNVTLNASDVNALSDNTVIGSGVLTVQKNGSTIDTFGANDTGNTTVNITINSNDVTNALGYTPYNSSNPDGYTSNVGTVTSVNNTQPDSNGNVSITIPSITIDSALSTTSTNPVQNAVITNALTDYANLINVTYSELVTLKSGGNLVEGAFYRITDYVTTSNGTTFDGAEQNRSAGHAFDIIIQAAGSSNLAEIGTAALHSGDTYFVNCNLGAWQIWYDIENNTNKYVWADTTNGKGVIYRMIDEHGNDLPYDFKNIQFYRDNTASKYSDIASSLTASDGYYYTFSYYANGAVKDLSIYDNSICTYNTVSGGRGLTGGAIGVNNIIFINPDISSYYFTGNKIGEESYSNTIIGWAYGNNFGMFFRDNIIKTQLYENEFSHSFKNNIVLGASFHHNHFLGVAYNNKFIQSNGAIYNTFGINFHDNTFNGTWVQGNQFGSYNYSNTFKGQVAGNIFGNYFYSNTFNATVQVNQFGNYINGNTVSANFNYNTINAYFASNTVNGQFDYNIIGSSVYRNTFNVVQACNFGNAIFDNTFAGAIKTSTLNNWIRNISFPADVNNVFIDNKIVGSSTSNRLNLTGIPTNISYDIHILLDVNGAVIAKWNDGANETGLYKATVTTSTWSDLLPTYTWET